MENYGAPLVVIKDQEALEIRNLNSEYLVAPAGEAKSKVLQELQDRGHIDENGIFPIYQNEEGIDIVERIEVGVNLIGTILNL